MSRATKALNRVVQSAVKTGHMVIIVGRGSQIDPWKGRRDVLHVRIVALLDKRIPLCDGARGNFL